MDGVVIWYVSTLMLAIDTPCMPSIFFLIKQHFPSSGDTMEVDYEFGIGIKWRFDIVCVIGSIK